MKSNQNSACINSSSYINSSNLNIEICQKNEQKNKDKHNLLKKKTNLLKVNTYNSNKQSDLFAPGDNKINKSIESKNKIFTSNSDRCKSAINFNKKKKIIENKNFTYITNILKEYENTIYSSNRKKCSRAQINSEIENTGLSSNKTYYNEFIEKQKLRNELENSCITIVKEISQKNTQVSEIKEKVSESITENKKIILIQQRFSIQANFLQCEIEKIRKELINVI